MIKQIVPNLYKLEIPLPGNPLKNLNSYLVVGEPRSLIIDTGFNLPECLEAILTCISILAVDRTKLDVLSTHFHADHTGLIAEIISASSRVYMSRVDREMFTQAVRENGHYWRRLREKYIQEGYPDALLDEAIRLNPAKMLISDNGFDILALDDGDKLSYGDFNWIVMLTPGHTPGHICLYEPKQKILITGDHLLFGISSNIAWWDCLEDSLSYYLSSLVRISSLEVALVLTGHRDNQGELSTRVSELINHHHKRLSEILTIVANEPGCTSYEIASKMMWKTPAGWAELRPIPRWFAVGETISHVEYLAQIGKLKKDKHDGTNKYFIIIN